MDSEGLPDSFTSRYSDIPTDVGHLWASSSGRCKTLFQLNRAGNTDLFGVQPLLNRMQHIHVDHALVTQALEHLTLVTNDRQPEHPHLALQRYGLQLIRGEIGIILQKPAGLNAGIMLEIQFVANIRQCLWADIVLGGKILQGIIGLLIHGTHRVEGFLVLGVVGGNLRPPNNRRQGQALHQHRHHDHGGHHEDNEVPVRHRRAYR